jgi:hypothetical protein
MTAIDDERAGPAGQAVAIEPPTGHQEDTSGGRANVGRVAVGPTTVQPPSGHDDDAARAEYLHREEYAFREGVRAYVHGFPWLLAATLRYLWTNVPQDPVNVPYAPLNRFWHARALLNGSRPDALSPVNDAAYSAAWLDLRAEPVILSHRDMGERFFAFDVAGMDLARFASIGARITGPAAGAFAIRGPDWHGTLPPGVVPLPHAGSDSVLVIGRTEVRGPSDMAAVREAQDRYRLVPLSRWHDAPPRAESRGVMAPTVPAWDALADWTTMNRAMTAEGPMHTASGIGVWRHLGIGPGRSVASQPPATRDGLGRAAAFGRRTLAEPDPRHRRGTIDGWTPVAPAFDPSLERPDYARWQTTVARIFDAARGRSLTAEEDRLGYPRIARGRAGLEAAAAVISNPVHAPVEFLAMRDDWGVRLTGGRPYSLRFEPAALPPARFFWALSLYVTADTTTGPRRGSASVASRSGAFLHDRDGGVTIAIAPEAPSGSVNWLASPPEGRSFHLVLRLYAGDATRIADWWRPPAVERLARSG